MAPPAPPPLPPPPVKPPGRNNPSAPLPPPPPSVKVSLLAKPKALGNGISSLTDNNSAWKASQQGNIGINNVHAIVAEHPSPTAPPSKGTPPTPVSNGHTSTSAHYVQNSFAPTSPGALELSRPSSSPPANARPRSPSASPLLLRKDRSHDNTNGTITMSTTSPPSTSVSSGKHESLQSKLLSPPKDALRKQISAPVAPQAAPMAPNMPVRALSVAVAGDTHSDYSSVGDYSDNHDFYDPNDAALEEEFAAALAHEAEMHQDLVNRSMSARANLENNNGQGDNINSSSIQHNDHDLMEISEKGDDSDNEGQEGVVRQNSNFSRLSAQSWLTVDSVEDVADSSAGNTIKQPEQNKAKMPPTSAATNNGRASTSSENSIADEDNPLNELRPDAAKVLETIKLKRLTDKSVFDCCIELIAGMKTYKKKTFRRFGERRVWLSADCTNLCWNSKKDNVESDSIQLQRVAKLKCLEREVAVDVIEGYRVSLLFSTPEEAGLWTRCLSCLIPLQAKVRAPMVYLLKEKDREDFTLEDDVFNGLSLREHFQVNSYAVLGHIKGHSGQGRLAFSRSEKRFVTVRYISRRYTPLLLRSYEEIAVLKRLSHPNIVKHHECLLYQTLKGTFVVSEHVARGTLIDTHKLEGANPIPENVARGLILEIIAGLEYLHSLSICHADLRPDNILRAVNGTVKLNPLGAITHEFTQIQSMVSLTKARLCGKSSAFLPPEMCWKISDSINKPDMPPKSYAMDVWAVGAVLYFMLYGRVPFAGLNEHPRYHDDREVAIQDHIVSGKLRFPRTPETSRNVRNLLKGVLAEKDPRTRIPLAELKMHPWFLDDPNNNIKPLQNGNSNNSNQPIIPVSPYGMQPLVVAPEEVDAAVQLAKVRIPA